ncbi:tetratricopeptide repeat protein, partial [Providencia sp. PROV271]
GEGVRQDYHQAFQWFNKAAQQGDSLSQGMLGILYHDGLGVRQNKLLAKEWFGKSCDNGNQGGCDAYRDLYK